MHELKEKFSPEIDVFFIELKTFDFIVLITTEFNKIISKRQQHVGKLTSSNLKLNLRFNNKFSDIDIKI
jgi:hypothetical protein